MHEVPRPYISVYVWMGVECVQCSRPAQLRLPACPAAMTPQAAAGRRPAGRRFARSVQPVPAAQVSPCLPISALPRHIMPCHARIAGAVQELVSLVLDCSSNWLPPSLPASLPAPDPSNSSRLQCEQETDETSDRRRIGVGTRGANFRTKSRQDKIKK